MEYSSEHEMVEKAIGGDLSAYGQLINQHQEMAFAIALRIVRLREDAEEITQDAFVKAWKNRHRYRGTAKFSTWLYRIVYNTAISKTRKVQLYSSEMDDEAIGQINFTSVQESMGQLAETERKQYLNEALNNLLPDDALVLNLFYLAENTVEEVGVITGWSQNNVKVRLHRARKRMYKALENILSSEVRSIL